MSLKKNFMNQPSFVKPLIIIVAVAVLGVAAYSYFGKKPDAAKNDANNSAENQAIKPSGVDQDQRVKNVADVENVIAKWIEANPQAIINSVASMQRKAMEEQAQSAQKNIGPKKDELFNDKNSPAYAPKGYDVTVVEFFDYNCGYCKKASPTIEDLIKSDRKVRVVYKEFPILGQTSEDMAAVALAVNIIDSASYRKFHNALMSGNVSGKADAVKLAGTVGINISKLEAALKDKKSQIIAIIEANRMLGGSIGIQGTPGFVVGEELIPGAIGLETLQQKIAEQRKK
jgi:protein-disulfide isomerase